MKYGAKYVSLKTDDPYEITPERALEVIRDKEIADANRLILDFPEAGIQVLNGRYGPYITDKQRNAKIPKDKEPKKLTLDECQTLLAAAPVRTFGKWGRKNAKAKSAKPVTTAAKPAVTAESGAEAKRTAAKRAGTEAQGTQRLAAKASKAAANKKAPLPATEKPAAAAKAKAKTHKKKAAKKKS